MVVVACSVGCFHVRCAILMKVRTGLRRVHFAWEAPRVAPSWKASISSHRKADCSVRWLQVYFGTVLTEELVWTALSGTNILAGGGKISLFSSYIRTAAVFLFLQIVREVSVFKRQVCVPLSLSLSVVFRARAENASFSRPTLATDSTLQAIQPPSGFGCYRIVNK